MGAAEGAAGLGAPFPAAEGKLARTFTSTPFLAAALAVLTWPVVSIVPTVGPDPSWVAGLYMATGADLDFGQEIVFTYGPLGFLGTPALYDQQLWILAYLFQAAIHLALALSLLWVARRGLPLAVAVAACYCLLVVGQLEASAVLFAFLWCFAILGRVEVPFSLRTFAIAGGILAAVELLVKANYGIAVIGLLLITLLGLPNRRRNLSLFVFSGFAAFLVAWLFAEQSLGAIPDFVVRSLEIASGYSGAMGTDILVVGWHLPAALGATGLLLAATALATWRDLGLRRLAALALVAFFCFMAFKQGFVRQGLGGTPEFFVLLLGAALAVGTCLPPPRRATAMALTVPFLVLALAASPATSIWRSLQPQSHVESMRQGLDALLIPGERERLAADGRDWMRSTYRVDPAILRAIGGKSVHVDPWEAGVAWAYDLNWQPLPVMQSYVAYSPSLDALNAAALAGADAPEAILRHRPESVGGTGGGGIDDRFPGWESPAAMQAMLCNYRTVRTSSRWQLLERAPNRCGEPRSIGTVEASTNEPIVIPRAPGGDDLVFARVEGLSPTGAESIRTALYRSRERSVALGERGTWRLVAATAADGLILRAPVSADFAAPFSVAPNVDDLTLEIDGADRRPISIEFFAQRIGPGGGPR
ncbi:MAG TPA: hypothetical protein VF030_11210 [Solirubrobacterales bacterium]